MTQSGFRHTVATLMLEGGADIRFIQAMFGHAELSATQIYTRVSIRKLKEVHTATHPARMERSAGKPAAVVEEDAEPAAEQPFEAFNAEEGEEHGGSHSDNGPDSFS